MATIEIVTLVDPVNQFLCKKNRCSIEKHWHAKIEYQLSKRQVRGYITKLY